MKKHYTMVPLSVEALKRLLETTFQSILQEQAPPGQDLLNIQQASRLVDLKKSTLYSYVSRGEVPYMKCGKRLYFSKEELLVWVRTNRQAAKENQADQRTAAALELVQSNNNR